LSGSSAGQRLAGAGIGELDDAVVLQLLGRPAADVGLGAHLRVRGLDAAEREQRERRHGVDC
jgi:hypothetical protein